MYCYGPIEREKDFHEKCSLAFFGTPTPPRISYSLDQMDELRKNLYGTLSVAKASTLLWAPRALGGEGLYEDIHGQGFNKSAGWDWDKATKADIQASAGFWMTSSIVVAIGMTNVATGTGILTAWAITTAVGSLLGGGTIGGSTGG